MLGQPPSVSSELFVGHTAGEFPFAGGVIEVSSEATVNEAFRTLVSNNILSTPVFDSAKNAYLGFFDVSDALAIIFSVDLVLSAVPDSMLNKQLALGLARSGVGSDTAIKVASLFEASSPSETPERTPWMPVTNSTPMRDVMEMLGTTTRRVPVIDEATGRVTKIISQSQVTTVLNNMLKKLEAGGQAIPSLFEETLTSIGGFGVRPVFCVQTEKNTTRDAFRLIIEEGVSAVGVLDDEGKLWTSISTKDIRLFTSVEDAAMQRLEVETNKRRGSIDHPESLMDMECGDFVSAVQLAAEHTHTTRIPAVVVTAGETLRNVISRLARSKKHRIFIVDDNRFPIGCVSVSDIAALLVGVQKPQTDPYSGLQSFLDTKFGNKTMDEVNFLGSVVEISSETNVNDAFRILVDKHILSAPVCEKVPGGGKRYLGFFDVSDAMSIIYSVDLIISNLPGNMLNKKKALELAKSGGSGTLDTSTYELTVGALLNGEGVWDPMSPSSTLKELISRLGVSRCKRIPIVHDGQAVKIISQSLVACTLHEALKTMEENSETLALFFEKNLLELDGWGRKPVITVNADSDTVREAFRKLIENSVSAVGVLDDEGKLLTSISTKDIRLFKSVEQAAVERCSAGISEVATMDLSCGDFVSVIQQTAEDHGDTRAPAVVVQETTSIRKIISRLAISRKHRIFVVDMERRPVGVISVSDICRILAMKNNC